VFHLSQVFGRLQVAEVILGESARCVSVATGVDCKSYDDSLIACCSLGGHILVTGGSGKDVFAALVDTEGEELEDSAVHITELIVKGGEEWSEGPCLCSVSDSRVLLYWLFRDTMWHCDVNKGAFIMKRLAAKMPTAQGFFTVPIRLPNGKLLVAGALPSSKDITLITANRKTKFEKVGEIPGEARTGASVVLVLERFVVGFGGWNKGFLGDLWVFDLRTRRGSFVRKEGEWHLADWHLPLVVQHDVLYLVGGETSRSINCIPLSTLASLISHSAVRSAFCQRVGVQFRVMLQFSGEVARSIIPPRL